MGGYMASGIQTLLEETLGDGARSSKFECSISFHNMAFMDSKDISMLVKTSQFPGKSHDVIDFKYKGRTIPLKGQVKYDNSWSCTFYLTEDHTLKKGFEDWIEAIDEQHNMSQNLDGKVTGAQGIHSGTGYATDLVIEQMDFHAEKRPVKYTLKNAFPKAVSGVDVDYSGVGTLLEFTVEFSYSHYEVQ
jgi:hypothetical protein